MTDKLNPFTGELQVDTDSFLQLNDTPNSYSSKAYYIPDVNIGETALEFPDALNLGDCIFSAREVPATPDANTVTVYLLSSGTTPNKVVSWNIKDESGNEVILYSMKI